MESDYDGGNNNNRGDSLSADTNLDSLNDEEFELLLKELTNHNLPEREKCPLVQHLKAEDARANTSYSSLVQSATSATTITTATGTCNVDSTISNSSSSNRSTAAKPRHRSHVASKDNEFRSNQAPNHQHQHHYYHGNHHQSSSNHCANKQQLASSKLIQQSLEEETELNSEDGGDGFAAEVNHAADDCDVDNCSSTNFNLSNVTTTTTASSASISSHTMNTMSSATATAVPSRFSGTRKNLKPNRANSFTMPSATSDIKNIGFGRTNDSNVVVSNKSAGAVTADNINNASSSSSSSDSVRFDPHLPVVKYAHLTSRSSGYSILDKSSQARRKKQPYDDDFIIKKYSDSSKGSLPAATLKNQSNNNIHPFHTSIHIDKMDYLVNSIDSNDSASMCTRLLSDKGLNSQRSPLMVTAVRETSANGDDKTEKMYVEMQNLRQKANIIEYNSSDMKHSRVYNSKENSVDEPIEMPMLGTTRYSHSSSNDDQYAPNTNKSNANTSPPNCNSIQQNCNYNSSSSNNNIITISSNSNTGGPNTSNRREKKKKQKEDVKLSQDIEGYIGFMDVADLESIINNTSSNGKGNGANLANGVDQNSGGGKKVNNKNSSGNNQKHDQNATAAANESQQAKNNRSESKKIAGASKKQALNKSQANSLSCDDISVNNHGKTINGIIPNNTSPELSSTTTTSGTKSKKNRSKRRQNDKNGKINSKNLTNSTSDSKLSELNKSNNDDEKDCQSVGEKAQNQDDQVQNQNSSSDDFEDATDAEDEEDEGLKLSKMLICSKQSNNDLLPTSCTEIGLNDVEHEFYTVSDSEMVDREKDFVTPKSKYLKRKKHLARKPNNTNKDQHRNVNVGGGGFSGSAAAGGIKNSMRMTSGNQKQHPGQHHHHSTATVGVNHLGRGYESERECSLTNSISNAPGVSQSLSSSMLAIDNGGKSLDKKSVPPPPANNLDAVAHFDKLVEEFPPAINNTLQAANSDNQLNITSSASDNGLKIPSYADIAKSFNVTNTKAQIATRLGSSSYSANENTNANPNPNSLPNNAVTQEFPQLDSSLPNNETASNDLCEVAPCESVEKMNGNGGLSVLDTKSEEKPRGARTVVTKFGSKNSLISSMSVPDEVGARTAVTDNSCNKIQVAKSGSLTAVEDITPVEICGNFPSKSNQNNKPKPLIKNVAEINGGFTDQKIVFGFFDDIQNEFDKIQDNYPFVNPADDTPTDETIDSSDVEDKTRSESCDDANLESFKKNAVHVNDLENHWQEEEASKVPDPQAKSSSLAENPKKTFSSSASSPLSSSFDSSPVSSSTLSSSSVQSTTMKQQEAVCFVSCLKKYRNVYMNDNAELNIHNYGNIVDYISCHWVNRKTW